MISNLLKHCKDSTRNSHCPFTQIHVTFCPISLITLYICVNTHTHTLFPELFENVNSFIMLLCISVRFLRTRSFSWFFTSRWECWFFGPDWGLLGAGGSGERQSGGPEGFNHTCATVFLSSHQTLQAQKPILTRGGLADLPKVCLLFLGENSSLATAPKPSTIWGRWYQ